jgi:CheY-like chemotaxis protein
MAASAILLVDVDVACDGPAALELSRRQPCRLASLDYKMQGVDGVELCGHLNRVHADTVGILVTAFVAVHAASRAGMRQILSRPAAFGRLIPLVEEVAGTP